jgi:ABC-type uncharacterized transport system involved in gliding motility auxiliary subunit
MSWWNSFQCFNRIYFLNRWVQVVLFLLFLASVNYLALRYFTRIDLTQDHRYALSAETRAYLESLDQPLDIIVTIPKESPRPEERSLYNYIERLLDEYRFHSRKDGRFQISVDYVDVYKDLERAQLLAREYGLEQANSVLVATEGNQRIIRPDELIRFEELEPVAFTGESALTSAIIEVARAEPIRLAFLTGHNETQPEDTTPRGLSELTRELKLRNVQVEMLDLSRTGQVPDGVSVVALADPQGPLLKSEIEALRDYLLNRAGCLLIWLRPGANTGMRSLLAEWGAFLPMERIVETDPAFREPSGSQLIRNFAQHPVSDSLIRNQTFLIAGATRPVIPIEAVPPDERLTVTPLLASSGASWTTPYREGALPSTFAVETDRRGPIPLAVVAERSAASQLGIDVPGGRLAVFGVADLFANSRVTNLGNSSLFFNTLNWMLDRDRLLAIPPRPVDRYQFTLSNQELRHIAFAFFALPLVIALLGFLVSWIRKS